MGVLRNALVYLGFVEDDLTDDMAAYRDQTVRQGQTQRMPMYDEPDPRRAPAYDEPARVRPLAPVRQLRQNPAASPGPVGSVHIVRPESYGDAQQIGDRMRAGLPVIVNLEEAENDLAKRIIAFASGLIYGLDGNLQKLSRRIYLLTPAEMEVSQEDRRRMVDDGGLGF